MTTYYYDAVVMGMEVGPLTAGALLAKRGFRVLVIGQNAPTDQYPCLGFEFIRRPFLLTGADAPVLGRVIKELGIGQLWQHATHVPDPAWQAVLPSARIDVGRNLKRVAKEIQRELPAVSHHIEDVFDALGRINGEIQKLFENDFVLPPETFLEKREFARVEVQNPFRLPFLSQSLKHAAELPEPLMLPLRWALGDTAPPHPLVYCRLLGGWLFDCIAFHRGRDGLRKLLLEQIVGQGGDVYPRRQATDIIVKRGSVTGLRIAGHDEITGCQMVLTHQSPRELSNLIAPSGWTKRFRQLVDIDTPDAIGYAINLGVRSEVISDAMAGTVFLGSGTGCGVDLLRIEKIPQPSSEKTALNVSCVLPMDRQGDIASGAIRDEMLDRVRTLMPFLDQHLEIIHSPFDGFGPIDLTGTAAGEAPRVPHPEEVPTWRVRRPSPDSVLGVAGLPHRTGIKGLLLSGSQMVSGLGSEGELIAAWGAARIACRMDPRRERLVKSLRSKVEI